MIRTRIEKRDARSLKLLEQNARYMTNAQFAKLVENIRRDGKLTSVPLVYAPEDQPGAEELVLSGNHRVQATIAAGVFEIDVMLVLDAQSRNELIARQLSHNAINGQDDLSTLSQLYDSIDDVDWRQYSGLDDDDLALMDKVSVESLNEVGLDFSSVSLVFLPHELDRAHEILASVKDLTAGMDEVWLAPYQAYEATLAAMATAHDAHGVQNVTTALALVLEVFAAHMTDLRDGWLTEDYQIIGHRGWPPLESIIGTRTLPRRSSAIIAKAIDRMVSEGKVDSKERFRALEIWASEYLGGEKPKDVEIAT